MHITFAITNQAENVSKIMLQPDHRIPTTVAKHARHSRTLRLEQFMALLPPPPPRVPLSSAELHIVASFVASFV